MMLLAILGIVVSAAVLAAIFLFAAVYFGPTLILLVGLWVAVGLRGMYGYAIGGILILVGIALIIAAAFGIYTFPSLIIGGSNGKFK